MIIIRTFSLLIVNGF